MQENSGTVLQRTHGRRYDSAGRCVCGVAVQGFGQQQSVTFDGRAGRHVL